jgi:hypothetical protein
MDKGQFKMSYIVPHDAYIEMISRFTPFQVDETKGLSGDVVVSVQGTFAPSSATGDGLIEMTASGVRDGEMIHFTKLAYRIPEGLSPEVVAKEAPYKFLFADFVGGPGGQEEVVNLRDMFSDEDLCEMCGCPATGNHICPQRKRVPLNQGKTNREHTEDYKAFQGLKAPDGGDAIDFSATDSGSLDSGTKGRPPWSG